MASVERVCQNCGKVFLASSSDVKRGWGKYCNRHCKTSHQNFKKSYAFKPKAKREFEVFDHDTWSTPLGGDIF